MSPRAICVSSEPADAGVAILLAVVATASLSAVALALAVMVALESRAAASTRARQGLLAAADAALELAVADLAAPGWTSSLAGAPPPVVVGASAGLVGEWGMLDIDARTQQLQRTFDARNRWGANGARWHARGRGFIGELIGPLSGAPPLYVMTWVADDPADADADSDRDANGVLDVRIEVYGMPKSRMAMVATVHRHAHGVEIISWREPVD